MVLRSRHFMNRSAWLLVLAACAGSKEPAAAPETPGASESDAPPANVPFDRAAAAKAIAAVDVSPCYDRPPILVAQLHIDLTIMPNGRITEASADRPYANTEAGNCAAELFKTVRVAPYVGPPMRMGRTVPHAPVRGRPGDAKFDPAAVRGAALAQDLSECVELPGAGIERGKVTITVQPNGDVRTVYVDPPLGGTPRGECVARVLKSVMYPPYSGDPALGVLVEVDLKKKK